MPTYWILVTTMERSRGPGHLDREATGCCAPRLAATEPIAGTASTKLCVRTKEEGMARRAAACCQPQLHQFLETLLSGPGPGHFDTWTSDGRPVWHLGEKAWKMASCVFLE